MKKWEPKPIGRGEAAGFLLGILIMMATAAVAYLKHADAWLTVIGCGGWLFLYYIIRRAAVTPRSRRKK